MTLEARPRDCGGVDLVMTKCPVPGCGHRFKPQEKRNLHFEREHTPEDFGL